MSFKRTRVYYRNKFLHIGHLQTLFHNNNVAREHGGVCYAIIDDRQDVARIRDIKEDFIYLELDNIEIVSVNKYSKRIMDYTLDLVHQGKIYINYCNSIENDPDKIIQHIREPHMHFRLMLRCQKGSDPSIGYTKPVTGDMSSPLVLMFLFDYIIKVLDALLDITDIISTSTTEVTDVRDPNISIFFDQMIKLQYHRLDTYFIQGFKYSKKDWPSLDERDPYLLTIKGLKARHIPRIVLYAFYIHATQMGTIKIIYLSNFLRNYLNRTCDRVFGVTCPIKVQITNWPDKYTEYICKNINPLRDSTELRLCPLSNTIYMDQSDYGIDNATKLTKGRYCRLKHGQFIHCVDVEVDEKGPTLIHAEFVNSTDKAKRCVHWISSEWGREPVMVCFVLYQWFYTGQNTLQKPNIVKGYIERSVFEHLDKIYQLERNGYYVYDETLSRKNSMPTFIRICKIKN